jgi:3-oxoadipate enol-lactonase
MPFATSRDGVRVHYEVHDFTDPWTKPPVLLLQHGFGRNCAYWYHMAPYLARNFRVVCPSMRGFGASEGGDVATGLNLDNCLADLEAIIDDVGAQAVHFAGESMGGILGMALAALQPDRVRTLSLMTAPLFIREEVQKTFAFGHASWADAIEKLGVYEWARRANGATRFPPGTSPELIDWYAAETGKNRMDAMLALVKFAGTANVSPLIDRIRCPVLGLYPQASAVATDEQQEQIRTGIRDIRIVHLPSTFHMVWVLHPGVCARHISHFVAEHEGFACME